jgi:hypothetical protein
MAPDNYEGSHGAPSWTGEPRFLKPARPYRPCPAGIPAGVVVKPIARRRKTDDTQWGVFLDGTLMMTRANEDEAREEAEKLGGKNGT